MESLQVNGLDQVGLVEDTDSHALPPNAWSSLSNIRLKDGAIKPFGGSATITSTTIDPDCITALQSTTERLFAYAGGSSIYSYASGGETDISLRSYLSGSAWDVCVLGGVAIFNNGVENPQYFGGSGTCLDLPYNNEDGCTWAVAGISAQVIRTFKNYLFALGINDGTGLNPRRVIWSHPAEPGTVPSSWDITDDTKGAGSTQLSDTPGVIVDGLALRDSFIVYLNDAIYAFTYRGDSLVFNVRLISADKGLYCRKAVADIGGQHVFVSSTADVYLFDGVHAKSIADQRIKRTLFAAINKAEKDKVFVTYDEKHREVWVCYPSSTSVDCDQAYVWSVETNTWTNRTLPGVKCAVYGEADVAPTNTWADYAGTTWADNAGTTWGELATNPQVEALILGGGSKLYEMNTGNQDLGVSMAVTAQRLHLDIGQPSDWHTVTRIYPKASGGAFSVRIGVHEEISDTVSWSSKQTFTPGTDYKLDFRETGRLHAIEFSSEADVTWEVTGYEVQYAGAGRR